MSEKQFKPETEGTGHYARLALKFFLVVALICFSIIGIPYVAFRALPEYGFYIWGSAVLALNTPFAMFFLRLYLHGRALDHLNLTLRWSDGTKSKTWIPVEPPGPITIRPTTQIDAKAPYTTVIQSERRVFRGHGYKLLRFIHSRPWDEEVSMMKAATVYQSISFIADVGVVDACVIEERPKYMANGEIENIPTCVMLANDAIAENAFTFYETRLLTKSQIVVGVQQSEDIEAIRWRNHAVMLEKTVKTLEDNLKEAVAKGAEMAKQIADFDSLVHRDKPSSVRSLGSHWKAVALVTFGIIALTAALIVWKVIPV